MPPRIAPSPHPGADLAEVITGALAQEAALFTAGEVVILRTLVAQDPEARELWARLSLRGAGAPDLPVFRVSALRYDMDLPAAIARLRVASLVHTTIPDDRCASAFDVPALQAACRRLGLSAAGARAALVERLRGRRWVDEAVVLLAHTGLVRRAELLYFQRPWMDRATMVIERVGGLRWPGYTPTGGTGLFADRRALRQYERARAGEWASPEEPLAIALAGRSAAPLSPWRRAVEAVLAAEPSAAVLGQLAAAGASVKAAWALRLEQEGDARGALAVCRAGDADRAVGIALERTGRRLARTLGQGWVPLTPLATARVRRLRLAPGPKQGARPTWRVGDEAVTVEEAAIRCVGAAGRRALHAENWLWTSLYALVFRDLYFLPVPGMLPTARRDGPLDVGSAGFFERRREAVLRRLEEVHERGASPFAAGWSGERLAGLVAGEEVRGACAAIPGPTAAAVLGRLAREGWTAARGLPDLYIFPGPATRVEEGVPARLDDLDVLAEIKGPGDSLRDEQRVWHDQLLRSGIVVELWEVASGSQESA